MSAAATASLADRYLSEYDLLSADAIEVGAPAEEVWAAIPKTDLRDPVLGVLFTLPGYQKRFGRSLAGLAPEPRPGAVTFGRIAAANRGWTLLAERPGREWVIGSVSRFWNPERPTRAVSPLDFALFAEPGWARVVLAFSVEPLSENRCVLRYEARAAGTDAAARSHLRRHWRVLRPGVVVALKHALGRIRAEAEWTETVTGALADR